MTGVPYERCKSCRFWCKNEKISDPEDSEWGFGSCRLRPPILVDGMVRALMPKAMYGEQVEPEMDTLALMPASLWPSTTGYDWCGEYQREGGEVPL
jgi:hypothetical protein